VTFREPRRRRLAEPSSPWLDRPRATRSSGIAPRRGSLAEHCLVPTLADTRWARIVECRELICRRDAELALKLSRDQRDEILWNPSLDTCSFTASYVVCSPLCRIAQRRVAGAHLTWGIVLTMLGQR
jgi:hypothetical protein